jgi:hypothetical protein
MNSKSKQSILSVLKRFDKRDQRFYPAKQEISVCGHKERNEVMSVSLSVLLIEM